MGSGPANLAGVPEKEPAMAKGTEMETVEAATAVGYSPAELEAMGDFQWETVHTESPDQVVFDEVGDLLVGTYAGHEIIYPDPEKSPFDWFVQLRWTIPTGAVFTNAGYELRNAFTTTVYDNEGRPTVTDKIDPGSITRVELMKFVDVDQASEMKSFRVDVARPRNAANPA